MKNYALLSLKNKSKKLECLLQFLFGALWLSFEQLIPDLNMFCIIIQ